MTEQAELLSDEHEYSAALEQLDSRGRRRRWRWPTASLATRWMAARAWALIQLGELDAASALLERDASDAADEASIVLLRGVAAYKRSEIEDATRLFGEALELASASDTTSDRLRSDIFGWRSRCHRRSRDWVAAREDVSLAIEFAESCHDARRTAYAYFQASLVHERMGNWLQARRDAEQAATSSWRSATRPTSATCSTTSACFAHLLGDSEKAIELLDESFRVAVETGSAPAAGHVLCSWPRCAWRARSWRRRSATRGRRSTCSKVASTTARDRDRRSSPSAALFSRRAEADEAEAEIRAAERSFAADQLARPRGGGGDAPR